MVVSWGVTGAGAAVQLLLGLQRPGQVCWSRLGCYGCTAACCGLAAELLGLLLDQRGVGSRRIRGHHVSRPSWLPSRAGASRGSEERPAPASWELLGGAAGAEGPLPRRAGPSWALPGQRSWAPSRPPQPTGPRGGLGPPTPSGVQRPVAAEIAQAVASGAASPCWRHQDSTGALQDQPSGPAAGPGGPAGHSQPDLLVSCASSFIQRKVGMVAGDTDRAHVPSGGDVGDRPRPRAITASTERQNLGSGSRAYRHADRSGQAAHARRSAWWLRTQSPAQRRMRGSR